MMSPVSGGSTLMTSAPRSPSSCPANGPAMNAPSSSTRIPASGVSVTGRRVDSALKEVPMDFAPSARSDELKAKLTDFDSEVVRPAEPIYRAQREESGDPHFPPPVMEELKTEARKRDLWNMFLPGDGGGADRRGGGTDSRPINSLGLGNLDYAPLCEVMGTSPLLGEATNCSAPDTGNMEILAQFGTPLQQEQWLQPLLEGEIRSCFAMTEPWVASSDATNISSRIERAGDGYVINGHKWFTSGALDPRCQGG